jgi:predicted dehydrogenase
MDDTRIRIAMVGCGAHSHVHAKAMGKVEGASFAACCDRDEEKARSWAALYGGIPSYAGLETMLRKEAVDAVILCTWPSQHREQIETCLSSGVTNILCEKSLTLSGADAAVIMAMAAKRNAFLMEAVMYRHHPAIRKLEALLSHPEAGPICSIRAVFTNREPEPDVSSQGERDWRLKQECGGGVPHDWMSYCVNAANHFSAGAPRRVFSTGGVSARHGVVDRLYGMIEYDNGVVGIVESSRNASFSEMLQITCAGSILELPIAWGIFGEVSIRQRHRKQDWPFILTDTHRVAEADSYELQLRNFCRVIRGSEKPLVSLAESVVNAYTIEALVESAMEKRIVEVIPSLSR